MENIENNDNNVIADENVAVEENGEEASEIVDITEIPAEADSSEEQKYEAVEASSDNMDENPEVNAGDAQVDDTQPSEKPVEKAEGESAEENAGGDGEKPKQKRHRSSRKEPKPILDENGNVIERLSTEKAMRVLEAILFANGDEVYYEQFARIIGYTTKEAKGVVETYAKLYDNGAFPRGIRLVCYEKCCQLSTCPDMGEYVTKMIGVRGEPQLSNAAMETLAIVAYNQPVTRSYIEQVRGVDSTRPITVLLDRELIEEVGRLDVIGRPRLFGVTQAFFRTFGISSLEELPSIDLLVTE